MSKQVDERVVELRFDNQQFESNVKTTMSTLDKLKSALKFSNKADALSGLARSADNATSGITETNRAVGTLKASFSALQVMGVTALANITNAAVNAGRQLASALTVKPILDGLGEYETQINAVQTILSNTQSKGTTLDQVNAALDELNTYADQTIYNFSEMTRNIGTFTAAGVDLDTSVAAIKGIANLAAVSGSTSQQASTAMYQLSQALATGRVALMDWNSVVNAGMGGELFQEALKRTARNMGIAVDDIIEKEGSFRDSLTKGEWLTADVLNETLKQISGAYSEADLLAQGYTEDQAKAIVDLANNATDAATKVKTFTQLIDTAGEALGSGWAQSWEIIIGDFEEARTLFTGASDIINGFITESANARNELLQGWADLGGREDLIQGITNIFNALLSVIEPISTAFNNIFPPATAETLKSITEGFKNFTEGLILSEETSKKLQSTFEGVFSVIKIVGTAISDVFSSIFSFSGDFSSLLDNVLTVTANIGDFLSGIGDTVTESQIFANALKGVTDAVHSLIDAFKESVGSGISEFASMFSGVGDVLSGVADTISRMVRNIGEGLGNIFEGADLNSIIDLFNSGVLASMVVSLRNFLSDLTGTVEDSTGGFLDKLSELVDGVSENVTKILDSVRGSLQAWQTNLKANTLLTIAGAVAVLALSLTILSSINEEALTNALGAITVLFLELVGTMTAFSKLNTSWEQASGMLTLISMANAILILSAALKNLAGLDTDQIERGVLGLAGLATIMVAAAKALSSGTGAVVKGAFNLILLGGAVNVLYFAVKNLGSLDLDTLEKGLIGVGTLLGELGIFSRLVQSSGILKTAVSLTIIAAALEIFYDTVTKFGSMNTDVMLQGFVGLGAIFGEMAIFSHITSSVSSILKVSAAMILLSAALNTILPAFEKLGNMGFVNVSAALLAMAGAIRIMMDAINGLLDDSNIAEMGTLAWAFPSIIGAFNTLADAMQKLGTLSWEQIATSLAAILVSFKALMMLIKSLPEKDMGMLSITLPAITSSLNLVADAINKIAGIGIVGSISSIIAIGGAMASLALGIRALEGKTTAVATMLLAATAMTVLGAAIALISNSGIVGVATSLVALAGTFTVVGLATKIMKPMIPSMFSFAGALVTLSAALVTLGIGTAAVGIGLVSLLTGLSSAILVFATVDPAKAVQGLLILAGALTTLYIAAKLMKPMTATLLSMSGSVALFGISCMSVALGISMLVAALGALGAAGEESIQSIVDGLKALILGVVEMIPEVITQLMESFKTILLGLIDVIVEVAPQIADGMLKVVTETLQSLVDYGPQIVTFVIDFIISLLNQLSGRIGEIVSAASGFLNNLFSAIGQAMSGWDATGFDQVLPLMGGFTALVVAFKVISGMIPAAMAGALKMAAFIAVVGGIIAAFGALQQIPGLQWLITEGGNLLQSIGTAIGQFIGGIAGGFLEGATSTLPNVADSLSDFMVRLTPFLTGLKFITPEMTTAATNLAGVIMALTAANVVDALGSFLTGGTDYGAIGDKLVPFGEAMADFAATMEGVDMAALSAGAEAGRTLAELASSLPKEGGLAQAIFGETTDMGSFSSQIVAFGLAIKAYGIAVSGIEQYSGSMDAAAQAGQTLSTLASNLPKDGGLSAAIFGETTDMDDFGLQIVGFGAALMLYGSTINGIDKYIEPINQSVAAGQALSDLANALPDGEGGLAQAIFGGKESLSGFGDQLVEFGNAIKDYGSSLTDVDFSKIRVSTERVGSLITLLKGNMTTDLSSGVTNIKKIEDVGDAVSTFYSKIANVDNGAISNAVTNIKNLVGTISDMAGIDTSGVGLFQSAIEQLAQTNVDQITSSFNAIDLSSVGASLGQTLANGLSSKSGEISNASKALALAAKLALSLSASDFSNIGKEYTTNFAKGITQGFSSVSSALRALVLQATSVLGSYSNAFYNSGRNLAQGFANGINSGAYAARVAARAMANAAANAAAQALDEHSPSKVLYRIGEFGALGFVNAFSDYVSVAANAGADVAKSAYKGVENSMNGFDGLFDDLDANPTITPVLDLSEVRSGVNYINTALNGNANYSVFGQVNRIARGVSSNRQNGTTDDVIRELSKLRGDIQSMPVNQYTIDGITYDDGSAISGAVTQLIRATRLERRT